MGVENKATVDSSVQFVFCTLFTTLAVVNVDSFDKSFRLS